MCKVLDIKFFEEEKLVEIPEKKIEPSHDGFVLPQGKRVS